MIDGTSLSKSALQPNRYCEPTFSSDSSSELYSSNTPSEKCRILFGFLVSDIVSEIKQIKEYISVEFESNIYARKDIYIRHLYLS